MASELPRRDRSRSADVRPWDAVVVGGGPAGAVAARVLAGLGRRVLLAALIPPRTPFGEVLPGAAWPLLRDLGLTGCLVGHDRASGRQSAWSHSELTNHDAIASPHGAGWNLDRTHFDRELRRAAQDAGATLEPAQARVVATTSGLVTLDIGERRVEARWVIDATGRRAAIARAFGARTLRDHNLIALVARMPASSCDADHRTLIEASSFGWWYSARVAQQHVVALHVDRRNVVSARTRFAELLSKTRHIAARVALPAGLEVDVTDASGGEVVPRSGSRWLSVGDAAVRFEPLAGQGLLNALLTGARGAQAVDDELGARRGLVRTYEQTVQDVRAIYLRRRTDAYRDVTRFSGAPFWESRAGLTAESPYSPLGDSAG